VQDDKAAGRRTDRLLAMIPHILVVALIVVGLVAMNPRTMVRAASRQVRGVVHRGPQERPATASWIVEPEQLMAKVKTGVWRSAVPISGSLKLYNQRDSGDGETAGPTWSIAAGAGNVCCFVSRLWYDYNSGDWSYYVPYANPAWQWFMPSGYDPGLAEGEVAYVYGVCDTTETAGPSGTWPTAQVVKLASGTSSLTLNYMMEFGTSRLYRERTSSPSTGRDASPVYAKETTVTDTWEDVDHPWTYTVTFGNISWTGTQAWTELVPGEYGWWPVLSAPGGVELFWCQKDGVEGHTYAESIAKVDNTGVDFSGGTKT
jgi:hypothetical protein